MNNPTRNIHKAYRLGLKPVKIEPDDRQRIGWILQNHSNTATGATIYLSSGGAYTQNACLRIMDGENANEDILAPSQDLWAFSDVDGAVLTVILKY